MPDIENFLKTWDEVKERLSLMSSLLDKSPEFAGCLSVDEYFFVLDLMRVRSYHVQES